jgi:serine/threonine protein kinase
VDEGHDQYTVVVEEFVRDAIRLDHYLRKHGAFRIDEVATVLRRAAEALKEFHDNPELVRQQKVYGLMSPRHVYYDERSHKLLFQAIGMSNFLWHIMGWERLATWQDEAFNIAAYVAPEQMSVCSSTPHEMQTLTEKTDQYLLGQLAFEMLEGQLPFDIRRPTELGKKENFWDDPRKTTVGRWPDAHEVFSNIIFRMLNRNPKERWDSFDGLIKRLRNLEDENQALAKRTYEGLNEYGFALKNNEQFFKSFYGEFFRRAPEAAAFFKNKDSQPKKLMDAMVAVLNFRMSNEPTLLREIVNSHLRYKITAKQLDDFQDTFLTTLKKKLPRRIPADQRALIINAWRDLFSPVVEYFKDALQMRACEAKQLSGRNSTTRGRW